jgi:uncharacterized membrane protein SpoIIM required for sporulation
MRESQFIQQNKEKWQEFEQILEQKRKDPDKLNELFVQVTDDLSYSRTFYNNRLVRVYLNGLAQKVFFSIYKTKRARRSRFLHFWTDALPKLVYDARKEFRVAFWLFTLCMLIGVLSSAMDAEFPRVILGDGYIEMTLENIEKGDPMGVYKKDGPFGMSLAITGNNLFVAFLTFVMGIFFAIGTIGAIIRNAVMVGVFQYFFVQRDLFWESFLTIWMHGTLEISAIIIAGAAGLTMGRGLVFPGTLTRLKSFQQSARRGLLIMLGITPQIIAAGFIEGYITRHTEVPNVLRGLFILLCLAFVLVYFVWYPVYKARKGYKELGREPSLTPDSEQLINLRRIFTGGELFSSTFALYRAHLPVIAGLSALAAAIFCASVFLLGREAPAELFVFPDQFLGTLQVFPAFFAHSRMEWLPVLHLILLGTLSFVLFGRLVNYARGQWPSYQEKDSNIVSWLKMSIGSALLTLVLLTGEWYTVLLFFFVFPLLLLWMFVMRWEGKNVFTALGRALRLLSGEVMRWLGLTFLLAIIAFLLFALLDTSILWFVIDFIGMNFAFDATAMDNLAAVLLTFFSLTVFYMIFSIFLYGAGIAYFTLLEVLEANDLRERLEGIGFERRIRGLAKER